MARALLAAALFGRAFAQTATSAPTASPTIAGYKAGSWVTPHAKIDLDMKEIVDAVGLGTAAGITEAINVYTNGGGGTCTQATSTTRPSTSVPPWAPSRATLSRAR